MRVLGVDYGTRRIGVAVSDELGLGARGVTTLRDLRDHAAVARLAELAGELGVTAIVVGLPVRADGTSGDSAERVRRFAERLAAAVEVPVHTVGEYLTSFAAEERLRAMGVKESERKRRLDETAAAIILEEFLTASGREQNGNG
jgi:putative Holliday junction resolvase